MNKLNLSLLVPFTAICSFAQIATTTTTLTTAVPGSSSASGANMVCLTSSTGVSVPGFGSQALTGLFVDREFMIVQAAVPGGTCWVVTRAFAGTAAAAHNAGATVYVGPTGGFSGSPFRQSDPAGGAGSQCVRANEPYLPQVTAAFVPDHGGTGMVWDCPAAGPNAALWVGVQNPVAPGSSRPYYTLDTGANNALVASVSGLTLQSGIMVTVKLAHTLQAGANTLNLNGGGAVAIKSHFNVANNIATVYAATGTVTLMYDGTEWVDLSQ